MATKNNKNIEKQLLEIAKESSSVIKARGDLKERYNDEEDFIEVAVWSIEKMLRAAYELGLQTAKEGK